MPLQIRRGTAAERTGLTTSLAIGELLYVTDQGKLYIGDGTSIGSADIAGNPAQGGKGLIITGFTSEEAQDATAVLFSNGSHTNISFSYNDGANALSAAVDLSSYTGNVTIDGIVEADFIGSIFAADSSVLVDAVDRKFFGDLEGNVVGSVIGDIKGSVFGDDSTLLVDGVSGRIVAPVFANVTGNLTGNVTGNLIGNTTGIHTGNVDTNLISSADSSTILVDTPVDFQTNVRIDGTLTVYDSIESVVYNDYDRLTRFLQVHDIVGEGGAGVVIARARGDSLSQTPVQTSDVLGQVDFSGLNSEPRFVRSCTIKAVAEGTVTSTAIPGRLEFLTADSSGTPTRRAYFDSFGAVTFDVAARITVIGYNAVPALQIAQFHDTQDARNITLRRARGTESSPLAVQTSDDIFEIASVAHDGTSFVNTSEITSVVDGIVSTGVIPSRLDISVSDETGSRTNKVSIKGRKTEFLTVPVLPTYADETAADAAIGGSGNRVNGMMYYDTALGKVRAVAGGSWTSLH